jgi:microcystin-dependent protein
MSQYDWGTMDPYVWDGVQLADGLNQFRSAVHSMHRGATRPTYAVPGMWWVNDSAGASNWVVNVYFGPTVGDMPVFTYNTTTGTISLATGTGGMVTGSNLQALDNSAPTFDWLNPTNPIDQKEFKLWLTSSGQLRLDAISDTGVATTALQIERDGAVPSLVPAGSIFMYAGTTASIPPSWFLCDGSVKSQTTEARLFAAIGTAFNIGGEATSDFRLPDLRGRVVAGVDGGTGRLTAIANNRGAVGGAQSVALSWSEMPVHNHSASDAGHAHYAYSNTLNANWGSDYGSTAGSGTGPYVGYGGAGDQTAYAQISIGNAGSGAAHTNVQPTVVMNSIIKR